MKEDGPKRMKVICRRRVYPLVTAARMRIKGVDKYE
jgi:hypothetical protein